MISELTFERWISVCLIQREKHILVHREHTRIGTVVRKDTVCSEKSKLICIAGAQYGSEKQEGKAVGLEREEEASYSTPRCWNFILEVSCRAAQGPTISE